MADAHGEVDAFFDEVDDAVEQEQLDLDTGLSSEKIRERGRHEATTEGRGRGDDDAAADDRLALRELSLGFRDAGQQRSAMRRVFSALFGEREATRGAIDEPNSELGFERGQAAHDRRQRRT